MRKRTVKKNFWLNNEEEEILKQKCKKANLKEAVFLRKLILGYEIKEKPDKEFYNAIKDLRGISINLNQIARKANTLNYIDAIEYKSIVEKVNNFILDTKEHFLVDKKKV